MHTFRRVESSSEVACDFFNESMTLALSKMLPSTLSSSCGTEGGRKFGRATPFPLHPVTHGGAVKRHKCARRARRDLKNNVCCCPTQRLCKSP